ncbi:MAG: efflux RND transporter periplasmic adaptor subunit [Candidatus Staskawiczbacteria bacterium]|nr:efflux RND transporter periplasmic adaptor subunit [Candidatus Staskawiczbacteria bacterium]
MQKTSKIIILAGVILVAIAIAVLPYFSPSKNKSTNLSSVAVKTGDITEKINLTGGVKASQGVDLAFEIQGKVVANYVQVGDKIYKGEALLAIDDSLLQAQLKQAQAQLDALNIDTVNNKINAGMQTLYTNSLSAAQKSVSTAKDIILTISDIQFNHFIGQTQENTALQNAKAKAINSLLGNSGAELWTSKAISLLSGGAFGVVQNAINNPSQDNIDLALSLTQKALQDVSDLINAVPIDPSLTPTERTGISMAKTNINLEIITTSANIQAISSQKVNNSGTITTTNAQIEAAQANIDAIKTQISKTVLTALFNGQVDKNNTIVGQIVSPNIPVITISNNEIEIDTNIPEIDLSQAKVGSGANVTLDAFGNSQVFPATITSIDSAPSVVNGISVYGAKLKFNTLDAKIKSGMTANITMISDTHSNVLMIPKSAVVRKDTSYFVIMDSPQREVRPVTIGLEDGQNIEITSGLKLGEKVFAY